MSADRERFIKQLEDAADNVSTVPLHELQVLLRRAALRLRNERSTMPSESTEMTPDELDDCLETIRWPAGTLAKALGRPENEVMAWIAGAKPVPAKTAAWIKTLAEAHQALEMHKPKHRA